MLSPMRTPLRRRSLSITRSAIAALVLLLPLVGPATPVLAAEDPPAFLAKWGTIGTGDGQFALPFDVAVHTDGSIYVVDSNNCRVQKFNSEYEYVLQWGTYGTGNSQFDLPYAIVVDSVGDVYVLDSCNHRVQKFQSDGTYITQWGSLYYPYGITVDDDGYVYVADTGHQCVRKYQSDGTYVTQ